MQCRITPLRRHISLDSIDILQRLSSSVAEAILEATDNGILIIDIHRKVVTYNSFFVKLWNIPPFLEQSHCDKELLAFVVDQLSYPQIFIDKVIALYQQPTQESFDTIRFKDGRIVERFSRPMYLEGEVVARVWSFREITLTETVKHELAKEVGFRKAILHTLPDLVWLKDPHGVYLACNQRFEDFFGAVEAEIIGKTDYDFLNQELADFFRHHDKKAMFNNAKTINEEWLTFAKDGHRELVETTKTPMYNDKGELLGILGISHDITDRVKSTHLLKSIIQTAPLRIFWKDRNLNYLGCNDLFAHDAGFDTTQQLIGKSDFDLVWRDQAPLYRHDDTRVMESGNATLGYEEPQTTPRGDEIWLRTSKVPLIDNFTGETIGVLGIYDDITEHKRMALALEESENFLNQSQNNAGIGSYRLNLKTMVWKSSSTLDAIFGIDAHDEHPLGTWINLIHPDDREAMETYFYDILHQHRKFDREYRIIRPHDNAVRWVNGIGKLELDATQTPIKMVGTVQDITKRKRYEQQTQEKQAEFETIFNVSKDGMAILDLDSNFLDFNDAYLEMTGFTREELLTKSCIGLSTPEDMPHAIEGLETILKEGFIKNFEKTCIVKDGKKIVINMTVTLMPDKKRILVTTKDVTQAKAYEHQLEHIAHYDPLTELPNRVLNTRQLRHAMVQARDETTKIAVLYLDLDGFKEINDSHGHSMGDQLLITLAAHMKQALRHGDTLARLGGDEFVIILNPIDDKTVALPIIQRLLDAISQSITIDGTLVRVSASIGVTFYPQEGEVDADQLIRQADQAMYSAKQSGKNRYHIFDPERDRTIRTRHEHLGRLQQALTHGEFILYYQPKVNMRTGKLIGAEALIRWQHPTKGIIPPLEFLPLIENHPLSVEVGEWVINEAITQIQQWQARNLTLPISVNIGAKQLLQGNFVQRLQEILAQHDHFDPSLLEMEILETSALENITQASQIIQTCKTMGIEFALDDFGTGYSSLTYLKRLPVTTLKIDQSFVRDMLDDRENLAILEGIVGLAKAFDRHLIAEGVETQRHGEKLLELGCDLIQGYGIARPMPPEKLVEWSQKWCKDHEWQG